MSKWDTLETVFSNVQEDERMAGTRMPRVFRPTPRLSPECSRLMEMLGVAAEGFLAEDNVMVSREGGVRFQNPLLVKKARWDE